MHILSLWLFWCFNERGSKVSVSPSCSPLSLFLFLFFSLSVCLSISTPGLMGLSSGSLLYLLTWICALALWGCSLRGDAASSLAWGRFNRINVLMLYLRPNRHLSASAWHRDRLFHALCGNHPYTVAVGGLDHSLFHQSRFTDTVQVPFLCTSLLHFFIRVILPLHVLQC